MNFQKKITAPLALLFLLLCNTLFAQQLTSEPAGGPDDNDLEETEKMAPANAPYSPMPSVLNFFPLNKYYNTWDTLYVRRYAETPVDLPDEISLPLISENESGFVFPVQGELLSPFGYRGRRVHAGIDLRLNAGDPVSVAFDGVVRMAKWYSGYGNCVVVRHFNGLETLYGHLSKLLVKVNQEVKAGDYIGLGGHTGRATCNHLHFETRFQGKAFNPRQIFDTENYSLTVDTLNIKRDIFGLSRDYMPGGASDDIASANNAPVKKAYKSSKTKKAHVIKKGETLSAIARKHGVSVKQLCSINKIKSSKTLRPGAKIRVK